MATTIAPSGAPTPIKHEPFTQIVLGLIDLRRTLDTSTPAKAAAAEGIINAAKAGILDFIPFPLYFYISGIFNINITRIQVEGLVTKIDNAIKAYSAL